MRISILDDEISFVEHSSDAEMRAALVKCTQCAFLSSCDSQSSRFHSVVLNKSIGEIPHISIGIGIRSLNHFPQPAIFIDFLNLLFWVGVNAELIGIDVANPRIISHSTLNSSFRCFIANSKTPYLLAFHEFGLQAMDAATGDVKWKIDEDLINTFKVNEAGLEITYVDKSPSLIDIRTGVIL